MASKITLTALLAGGILVAGAADMAMNYGKREGCHEYSKAGLLDQSRGIQAKYVHEKFTTKAKRGLFGVSEQLRYPFVQAELDEIDYCKNIGSMVK